MKTILKISIVFFALVLMFIADLPLLLERAIPLLLERDVQLLSVPMVPEAEAVMGVRRRTRRRTAVVVGSSVHAADEAQMAATAAPPPAAPATSAVPVGTVVQSLPKGCETVVVSGVNYSDCNGVFYKTAFQSNNLVYVVVEKPI
jgi:hypothetical protein